MAHQNMCLESANEKLGAWLGGRAPVWNPPMRSWGRGLMVKHCLEPSNEIGGVAQWESPCLEYSQERLGVWLSGGMLAEHT